MLLRNVVFFFDFLKIMGTGSGVEMKTKQFEEMTRSVACECFKTIIKAWKIPEELRHISL